MNVTSLESLPVWLDREPTHFPALENPANYDVAIIGGGITGLTAAYLIKQTGKRVAVFEKSKICRGDTGHTTAHLVYFTDRPITMLAQTFGEETAKTVWEGGRAAIDLIEEIVHREQIDCGFQRVPGYLHSSLFTPRDDRSRLQEEAALASKLGFQAVYREQIPLGNAPGVEFTNQGLFDPVAYLRTLADRVCGDGSQVYEQSEMTEAKDDRPTLRVNGHEVQINHLIIATHVPLTGLNGLISAMSLQSKLFSYSTYAVGGPIPKGTLPYGSYNDTDDPYHYLRITPQNGMDYAILGGEDHKTGKTRDIETRYARLELKLRKLIPDATIDHRWSGQVVETNDGLPYIGPSNPHQFIASGFSGNGMTYGTLSAMMARDWTLGAENQWASIFRLSRKKVWGGLWDYLKENKDYPYELIKGYWTTPEGEELAALEPGEGKVLKVDGQRRAVYRAPDGKIQSCSAICTHMGCVVNWNPGEQTWDCPCHGSRFSTDGQVIAGPAETPLARDENSEHLSHNHS
ncbi:FAD-dependent oxidoreductase [Planctomicrobium sp. SH664]|uniref:FAD-dependent oxidoreductase n=1 Tax=Planctomicrobium sp. SH664 TaxID=3448125 RepID=UPI003F5C30E7